jgi:nucleoside-diphosphate-sugar epimerase
MTRWITDRLGTASYLDASAEPEVAIVDVRDLLDGAGNAPADVRRKIEEGLDRLMDGSRVIVCCEHGISRSNAVVAGILAMSEGVPLDSALDVVVARTGEDSIRLGVIGAVRAAIGEHPKPTIDSVVLVTGGTGFVGGALTQLLGDVLTPPREEIDLLHDSSALDLLVRTRGVSTIVHLAQPRILTNRTMGDSLTMLKNVLDVCVQNAIHLVHLSGWEVFAGYRDRPLVVDETLPLQPADIRGYAWALAEGLVQSVATQAAIRYSLIRSATAYRDGAIRPSFLKPFVERALMNEPLVTHRYQNGLPHLDLMHLGNLVSAVAAIVEQKATGVFHFGAGLGVSTRVLAEKVIAAADSTSPIVHHEMEGRCPNIVMSTSKARSHLGWVPHEDQVGLLDAFIHNLVESERSSMKGGKAS